MVMSSFFTTRVDYIFRVVPERCVRRGLHSRTHETPERERHARRFYRTFRVCLARTLTLSRAQEREVDLLHLDAELATKVVHPLRLLLGEDERDGAATAPLAGGATSGMHV